MEREALNRLQALIDRSGHTHKSVSRAAGMSDGTVNTWFPKNGRPGVDPSVEKLRAVATVLNASVEFILNGSDPDGTRIPVIGIASAGEGWANVDRDNGASVQFDMHRSDAMAVEVRGASMHPVYRDGDFIVCGGRQVGNFDNLIGLDCVVLTRDGTGLIKILQRGRQRGKYTLKSYNFATPDIEDVELEWVAPIDWIKRGRR